MSDHQNTGHITEEMALARAMKYCAYQERCYYEVRTKLLKLGLQHELIDQVLSKLTKDGFINEERFAKTYAEGKFRLKKWGKNKIENSLKQKQVSPHCITKGLEEIVDEDYMSTLQSLIKDKLVEVKADNEYELKHKVASFVIRKGFEPELVWNILSHRD